MIVILSFERRIRMAERTHLHRSPRPRFESGKVHLGRNLNRRLAEMLYNPSNTRHLVAIKS
jgi:hypothetical protein